MFFLVIAASVEEEELPPGTARDPVTEEAGQSEVGMLKFNCAVGINCSLLLKTCSDEHFLTIFIVNKQPMKELTKLWLQMASMVES